MDNFPSIALLEGQTWKIGRVIFHLFKKTDFIERFSIYSDIRGETWKSVLKNEQELRSGEDMILLNDSKNPFHLLSSLTFIPPFFYLSTTISHPVNFYFPRVLKWRGKPLCYQRFLIELDGRKETPGHEKTDPWQESGGDVMPSGHFWGFRRTIAWWV
jgi:hypothetical protein